MARNSEGFVTGFRHTAYSIPLSYIEKVCFYLAFITGFFEVAIFSIDLGPFTIFPYRIFLTLLWVLFVTRALTQGKLALPIRSVKPYIAFLGLWIFYAVISLGWAISKGDSIRQIVFLFMDVSMIFFAIYYLRSERDIHKLYWIWYSVFCSLILLGFWEHLTGQHLLVSGYNEEELSMLEEYVRAYVMYMPTGSFHNPNDNATFLALSIPFAIGLMRYVKNRIAQLAGLGGTAAAFYLIVAAGSRANMLAVLLELAILLLFLTGLRQKAKVVFATVVCLAIVLLLFSSPVLEFFSKLDWELISLVAPGELTSGSVAVRANLVRNGLEFLYSTAGFGVGAGNAEFWMANFAKYDTWGVLNPHSWWLEILTDYGIFVFAGYLLFNISLVRGLLRARQRLTDRGTRVIAESILVAMVGFLIASISSSSIMAFNPNQMLFAFAIAFLNYSFRRRVHSRPQCAQEGKRE